MISVIIPVYNGEKFIIRCLDSLKAQTFKKFEVIIVDNNSKDNTSKLVQDYCENDKRFIYHFCIRAGVSNARNAGMSIAKGDYFFFLDADDEMDSSALELMHAATQRHDCDIVVTNVLTVQDNIRTLIDTQDVMSSYMTDGDVRLFFYQKLPTYLLHVVFKLYSKEFLRYHSLIFDPTLSLGEDLLFNIAAFSYAQCVYYLNMPAVLHYIYDSGLTMKYRKDLVPTKIMLHNIFSEHLKSRGLFDISYYHLLMNDVFAMIVNENSIKKVNAVLDLDCTKELLESGIFKHLSLKKKINFILIKLRFPRLLKLSATIWKMQLTKNVMPLETARDKRKD